MTVMNPKLEDLTKNNYQGASALWHTLCFVPMYKAYIMPNNLAKVFYIAVDNNIITKWR